GSIFGHTRQSAIEQRRAQKDAHAHGVEERHYAETRMPPPILVLSNVSNRSHQLAAVTTRHAFWAPGGPGGVKHQACRGLADRGGTGERGRIAQACEWRPLAFAVCGNDHTSRVYLEPRSSLGGRSARGAVERHGCRFGVLEAIPDLVYGRAPAHRREDDAEQLACPVKGRHLVSIPHHHHEMVALPQPGVVQAAGNRRDVAIPIGIAHPTFAFDERLLTRLAHHRRGTRAAEIHGHDLLPMAIAASSTAATIGAYPVHRQM